MNRTTFLLSAALVTAVAGYILFGNENGIVPLRVFGTPTVEPFLALPTNDSGNMEKPVLAECGRVGDGE